MRNWLNIYSNCINTIEKKIIKHERSNKKKIKKKQKSKSISRHREDNLLLSFHDKHFYDNIWYQILSIMKYSVVCFGFIFFCTTIMARGTVILKTDSIYWQKKETFFKQIFCLLRWCIVKWILVKAQKFSM